MRAVIKSFQRLHIFLITTLIFSIIVYLVLITNLIAGHTHLSISLILMGVTMLMIGICSFAFFRFKKTQKMLLLSESRYQQAQEIAHLGSWDLDLSTNVLTWSDEVYRIFGIKPQEFAATYEAFLESVHPDDREKVDRIYSDSVKYGSDNYEVEHRIIRRDSGEIRYVHEKCYHTRDSTGNITRSVGMVHDITERKRLETLLRQACDKLNIALENANIGVWEWDLIKDEIYPDRRINIILGIDPDLKVINLNIVEKCIAEEDVEYVKKAISETISGGPPLKILYRIRHNDGQINYISTRALVTYNTSGQPLKMTGVCFDVTDMKKADEELLFEKNEELLRSNKALEQFAYIASHDLQEPLRMISSFTQLIESRYSEKLDDNGKEFIRYVVDGAKRMSELINSLLSYSRIQTRKKDFSEVNLNHVINRVKKNLSLRIEETRAEVSTGKLPVIFADENQMLQLFQNLVANAIKFSQDIPSIAISANRTGKDWVFSVRDKGIGIDPQYFERIFVIFQHLHPEDRYKGTGIGLAVCKSIVERHGGKIWVESEPGKGAEFFFTIPYRIK